MTLLITDRAAKKNNLPLRSPLLIGKQPNGDFDGSNLTDPELQRELFSFPEFFSALNVGDFQTSEILKLNADIFPVRTMKMALKIIVPEYQTVILDRKDDALTLSLNSTKFTNKFDRVVKEFQRINGLIQDGDIGPITLNTIDSELERIKYYL